jgi:hypothetical protein
MDTVDALQYRRNTVSRSSAGPSLRGAVEVAVPAVALPVADPSAAGGPDGSDGSDGPDGLAGSAVSGPALTAPPAGSR